ncbi:MAG: hypothetical protein R2877_08185 [Bdellovibrionota bacterium]
MAAPHGESSSRWCGKYGLPSTPGGVVIVADGSEAASKRLERVLHNDPLMGVYRHVDAGHEEAIAYAKNERLHPDEKVMTTTICIIFSRSFI